MFLFIISIILLTLFVAGIYNLLLFLSKLERILTLFLIVTAYLVLILELAGLLKFLNRPLAILSLQFIFLCLVLLLNPIFRIGLPKIDGQRIFSLLRGLPSAIGNHMGLFLFGAIILVVYIFLLYIGVRFPHNTFDSLYNHLSRIGYWLQQGSLSTYQGFNNYGTSYPYINSLLMIWSVIFLRSDSLVGLVQYFSTFVLAISIYLTAVTLGLSKKGAIVSALIVGTFPIILFESITSQNDILVSAYLIISFYFLLRTNQSADKKFLILSILAFSMAIGTKQYAFFALPGYAVLMGLVLVRNRPSWRKLFKTGFIYTTLFVFLFGSYSYLQNWISFGTPLGRVALFEGGTVDSGGSLLRKITLNSTRLTYQFLTCEGIPTPFEQDCIQFKVNALRPVLTSSLVDIESPLFQLESENPFSLETSYSLNQESSWFGIQGWLVLLPAILIGFIYALNTRKPEILILYGTSLVYFLIMASFKPGWDPYVGRYLIFSTVLLVPLSALIFQSENLFARGFTFLICFFSLASLFFSVANNDLRPLLGKRLLYRTSNWGKENSILVHKISDRIEPWTRNIHDVWSMDEIEIQTIANQTYEPVIRMLEEKMTLDYELLVLALPGNIPDYLFFGGAFQRVVVPVTSLDQFISMVEDNNYLLISPDFSYSESGNDRLLAAENGWRLFFHP